MFLGHFAVGLAGKKAAPQASLGTYFLAGQFLDLLWPTFLLLNLEKVAIAPGITAVTPLDFISYPFSHSLLAAIFWSALFAGVYALLYREKRESLLLGGIVLSHWILDFITHRPDMPLTLHSETRVGLGLWFNVPATLALEAGFFIAGIVLYTRATKSRRPVGKYALWSLVAFLSIVYMGAVFGPPPPNVAALALTAQSSWLLIAWGYWIDRNREAA